MPFGRAPVLALMSLAGMCPGVIGRACLVENQVATTSCCLTYMTGLRAGNRISGWSTARSCSPGSQKRSATTPSSRVSLGEDI